MFISNKSVGQHSLEETHAQQWDEDNNQQFRRQQKVHIAVATYKKNSKNTYKTKLIQSAKNRTILTIV